MNAILQSDAERVCRAVDFRRLDGATVLITGATGLIGTGLLASLCLARRSGATVRIIAQHRSEVPDQVARIVSEHDVRLLRMDLSDPASLTLLPACDIALHCAGYAQPALFTAEPVATIHVNTTATDAILRALARGGRFLFLSSTEVYSGQPKSPLLEDDIGTTNPLHPRSGYIEGKRCGEAICNAYRQRGVSAKSARVSVTYGPGTRGGDMRALNMFIEKALCTGAIRMLDAGTAIRTYCYVSDTVEMLWRIALDGTQPVYNVGGRSSATFAELAHRIGALLNAPVEVPAVDAHVSGAPADVRIDTARYEQKFGAKSFVSLDDGLRATIDWQRTLYAGSSRG